MNTKLVTMSQIIGENGVFLDGDWVESKDQDPSGSIRLIQLADIGDGYFIDKSKRYLTKESALNLKCTFLKQNDILIARMPDPIGRACIFPHLDTECVTVVDVCIVRPDKSIVLPEYLKYLINNQVFRRKIQMYVTGTTRQRISRGNLAKIEFKLPPLEDQKRIVELLDQAVELKQKRKESIGLLDNYLKAVFIDMFGNTLMNSKGWKEEALENQLEFMTSGSRGWAKYYSNKGSLFLTIKNVSRAGTLLLDEVTYVNAPDNAEAKRTNVKENDVLLSITADLGRTAVVKKLESDAYINQHLVILRTKSLLNPQYLSCFLCTTSAQVQIQSKNKGAAKAGLNFTDIKSLKILIPPLELQNEFEKIVKHTEQTKLKMLLQSVEMDNQFKALMQKIFRT